MKVLAPGRSFPAALLGGLLLVASANAQMLVEYDPVGQQGSGVPVFPTTMATGLTASDLSQLGFLGGWGNTDVWPVGQLGAASPTLDPAQYVTFEITSSASIDLTALTYSRRSYVGEGNQQAAVRTSLDGFMADVDVVTGLPPTGDVQIDFDLSSLAPVAGTVTFRIYFYDAALGGLDWVDLVSSAQGGTGIVLTGVFGGLGSSYCTAATNSTGQTGSMSAQGLSLVSANDVTLMATQLPPNSFGFFITSRTQGFVMGPAGSFGNLCLLGAIGRYVGPGQIQMSGTGGSFSLAIDLATTPQPTGIVSIQAGETWNFQAWHRDVVMGTVSSNFTDGLQVTFQ